MTAQVIDGRKAAARLSREVAAEAATLREAGLHAGLATVLVGDDLAAGVYQRRLGAAAGRLGVPVRQIKLPDDTPETAFMERIRALNKDPEVSGILLLRPLPAQISQAQAFASLVPEKDIESVHPENAGLLVLGVPRFVPSTAASVFYLLDHWLEETGVDQAEFYQRSSITVVGRSDNVGKPCLALAAQRNAAVQSVDEWASRAGTLGWHTRRADVLVVAAGRPGLIRAEHVNANAVVIDVGINPVRDESGRTTLVGDVDFGGVLNRARALTPVPGGVGPVTDLWLIRNTIQAARELGVQRREAQ